MFPVEQQFSWTMNIIVRALMYLAQTYTSYLQESGQVGWKIFHFQKNFSMGKNVLREFLVSREKEVISIMMTLFDDEKIMRTHVASEKKAASKETARKAAKNICHSRL